MLCDTEAQDCTATLSGNCHVQWLEHKRTGAAADGFDHAAGRLAAALERCLVPEISVADGSIPSGRT